MNSYSSTYVKHPFKAHIPWIVWNLVAIGLFVASVTGAGRTMQIKAANSSTAVDLQVLSTSIAADGHGNTYYVDTAHSIIYKTSMSGVQTQINCCSGLTVDTLSKPRGVALDSSGDLYIADTGNNRIVKLSPSLQASLIDTQLYQLSSPSGIVLDADNDLYIADSGNNRVIEVSAGGQSAVITTGSYKLSYPLSVSLDNNNNLFITDTGNNRVVMIPASGSPVVLYADQLNAPLSVTPNANGSAYIAQTGSTVNSSRQGGGSELPAVVASFSATNMNLQQGDGAQGSTASVSITLTPLAGFNSTIYLSVLGLPPNTEAQLSHPVITLNGNSQATETLEIGEVSSGQSSGSIIGNQLKHFPWQSKGQMALAGIAPISLFFLIGLRRSGRSRVGTKVSGLIVLLVLLPSLALTTSGCKGGYPAGLFGNQTYTATLVAQSTNGQGAYSLGSFGITLQ